jgi:hypothetical protein
MKTVRTIQRKKFWLYIGLAAFVFLSPGCSLGATYQRRVHLSQRFEAGQTFKAKIHNGAIRATGIETPTCDVTAVITGRAQTVDEAKKIAERIDIVLDSTREGLTARIINPPLLETQDYSIDYHILLPSKTRLEFETHNGAINVERMLDPTHLLTHNGSIDCLQVSGRVQAQTHNGPVRIRYDKENLNPLDTNISTHNGSIEIDTPDDLSALLNISTHNGSINVVRPVTVSGRIEKNYLDGRIGTGDGRIFLRTHNGSVTFR